MRRWPILLLSFAAICGLAMQRSNAASTAVPSDIQKIFKKPLYEKATWGLRVLDGTRVLIDYNSNKNLYIGSERKLFSVGALLNRIGANHTYDTPVYRQGTVDANKTLHGNLIVVASGDLTMGGRTNPGGTIAISSWDHNEADSLGSAILTKPNPLAGYQRLARAIKASGIDRVAGDVVIDDRLFLPFFFRGEFNVRPIFINDDVVDLTIVPARKAGTPANVTSRPNSAALRIDSQLGTGTANSKNTLAITPRLPQCIGLPNCTATVKGSLPSDFVPALTKSLPLVQTVRIVQPANYARTVLVQLLTAAGVKVDAPAVEPNPVRLLPVKGSYRANTKVAELTGMRYGQDAKFILKVSYNIGADTSLVLDGLTRGVNSMPGALRVERQDLATHYGIASNQYHFVDGSGGGETTATNVAVTTMLADLMKARERAALLDALPVLAVDGSLASVKAFQQDPTLRGATGQVRAKTGTYVGDTPASREVLKGQGFAGYITTKSGKHLTYQVVVNNVPITSILDVLAVFQDEGTISAMLWRDY